jgi:hypothetical protein
MNNSLLSAILLIFSSLSYGQTSTENINIFGVEFVLTKNRVLTFKNQSNSGRVVEVKETTINVMSYSKIKWENKMNVGSYDKIFLTNENSEVKIVVMAEYADDKEISFTYILRTQGDN